METSTQQPEQIIHIKQFFGIEIKLFAVYWIGIFQAALWAAGPHSGYGFRVNTERSPRMRFPHLEFDKTQPTTDIT